MAQLVYPQQSAANAQLNIALQANDRADVTTTQAKNNAEANYTQAMNEYNKSKNAGMGSGIGSLVGAGLGALLAIPTGGLSLAGGAMLGSGFGGAAGSLFGGGGGSSAPYIPPSFGGGSYYDGGSYTPVNLGVPGVYGSNGKFGLGGGMFNIPENFGVATF